MRRTAVTAGCSRIVVTVAQVSASSALLVIHVLNIFACMSPCDERPQLTGMICLIHLPLQVSLLVAPSIELVEPPGQAVQGVLFALRI